MFRKTNYCSICENRNLLSICLNCVNHRLADHYNILRASTIRRDVLYSRLEVLLANIAGDQVNWRASHDEKIANLRETYRRSIEQLGQGKARVEKIRYDHKVKSGVLESSLSMLESNRLEQLEKFYPNFICTQTIGHMAITSELLHKQAVVMKQVCKLFPQNRVVMDGERKYDSSGQYDQICSSRLPIGLDPHSIPSQELAASLGYMVQLLNLVLQILAAPALHSSGFAGSCSRIWQRDSYWNAHPSSQSNEYPLYIPRQNYCFTTGENSWSDRNSINYGVTSIESEGSGSLNYSSASPHSVEMHKDLQKGMALLKKSIACLTTYCYNSLGLDVSSETSTFKSFAILVATLSSSKELRSICSIKLASPRSNEKSRQLNKSVWNVTSPISSASLMDSVHAMTSMKNIGENNLPDSAVSFFSGEEFPEAGKKESLFEGWDLVEHATFPPPSHGEDVEHWTRAMFIDATKK